MKNKKDSKSSGSVKGFTLIELMIAAAIIGVLSIVSTQLLFDTVTVKSKQYSLEISSDSSFQVIEQMVGAIKEAKKVEVKSGGQQIEITGETDCLSFRYNSTDLSIEEATDTIAGCSPTSYSSITPENFHVKNVNFSPEGSYPENVSILVEGEVKDSLSTHPFSYETNVIPRVSL